MINASSAFRRKLNNDERDYLEQISMTLKDGTELSLTNADIWGGSLSFDDSVGSDGSFSALGSCIVNSLKFTLNNIYDDFSEYDFLDAVSTVKIGLDIDGTPEMLKKGVFTVVDPTYNGSTISLVLHDNMAKFDRPYSDSTLVYPASLDTIVRNLCTVCGVNLATSSMNFPRKDFVINERPSDEATTCREVLSWCATIAGCFARCNADGELELKWFNTDSFGTAAETLDGGRFDNHDPNVYVTGDTADGGTFNPWSTGDAYDGGSFDYTSIHIINSLYSQNIAVDDVVITQIQAEVKIKADTGDAVVTYSEGQPGYAIKISGNEFINETNAQGIVTYLGNQIIGTTFRKANVSHASDPTIEAGDCAFVYDRKGNRYNILITRTNFTVGSAQTTVCGADTPARNSAARYTEQTKSYVEIRKKLIEQKSEWEQAVDDLSDRIDNAGGMYETDVQQTGGGVIHYLHNKPLLAESDIRIVVSDVGVTVTANGTDPNPTWYGLTVDGQLIASILNTVGINADWINSGQLVIKDQNNNETFFADTTTGIVRINASSFTLKSSGSGTPQTIQQIADSSASTAQANANNYTDTQVASARSDANTALTTFINGSYATFVTNTNTALNSKITTYYQTSAPSSPNVGDLWVDTDNSNVLYRYNGSTWDSVRDAGIQSAITAASNAQTTADGKIITFAQSSQPTAADVGDLWIDTDDDNKLYRWNGSQWQSIRDSGIQSAITTANNAQTTASAAQTAASNAQTAATDAAKVATNYLDYNDTDGLSVGYRQSAERAVIKGDGMEIYDSSNDQIAQFKAVTRLGLETKGNLKLDYHSLQLQDIKGNTYVHLSDLRDNTGYATLTEIYVGDGSKYYFYLKRSGVANSVSVTVNGSTVSNYEILTGNTLIIKFNTAPSSGSEIVVTYKTANNVRAYTFGTRKASNIFGNDSFVNGNACEASGNYSHAEGYTSIASGDYSHAEGALCVASGYAEHAEGSNCKTSGHGTYPSHAEGYFCNASGMGSHAEGRESNTTSGASYAHAEGYMCTAELEASHAEGYHSTASGQRSHSEGYYCTASGHNGAHAEGFYCKASGDYSHAEGYYAEAKGRESHASGYYTVASSAHQFVCGAHNVEISTPRFIIGGGTANSKLNLMIVSNNGSVTINGTLTQSSDKRLKYHKAYLSDQEQDVNEFVNQLKPVWFEKDEQKHLGFYAQDVQQTDRWQCMVDNDTNGYLTLGYTEIIAPLVAYCQNQQKKIESLEERIARLEQLLNNQ